MSRTDPGLALGVDSCTNRLGLALADGSGDVAMAEIDSGGAHCEALLPALERLLAEAGRGAAEIRVLGVTSGPGRFTSLRIGLATVQGLAVGLGIGVVPLSALEAIAAAHANLGGAVAAALDGGGGVYAGLYLPDAEDPLAPPRVLEAPAFGDPAAFAGRAALAAEGRAVVAAGSGAELVARALRGAGIAAAAAREGGVARVVARIAAARRGEAIDPAAVEPVYLRKTQAEERHGADRARTH